jgi:hypothetical protein
MDLEAHAEAFVTALKLRLDHFGLPSLAALSTTNRCCRARVQAALCAATPATAQQLLLQTASLESPRIPPVAVLKPLLERASSIADGAARERFATALAIKAVSQPGITRSQARVWLSSGLQLSDAIIYAAAHSPYARPALWVQCHTKMLERTGSGGQPLSPMLQAICLGRHAHVSFAWC